MSIVSIIPDLDGGLRLFRRDDALATRLGRLPANTVRGVPHGEEELGNEDRGYRCNLLRPHAQVHPVSILKIDARTLAADRLPLSGSTEAAAGRGAAATRGKCRVHSPDLLGLALRTLQAAVGFRHPAQLLEFFAAILAAVFIHRHAYLPYLSYRTVRWYVLMWRTLLISLALN